MLQSGLPRRHHRARLLRYLMFSVSFRHLWTIHASVYNAQFVMAAMALTVATMRNSLTMSACDSVPHPASARARKKAPQGFPDRAGAHQRSPRPWYQKSGLKTKRATRHATAAMRFDDSNGRMIVHARLP